MIIRFFFEWLKKILGMRRGASSHLRRSEYDQRYLMTLAEWLLFHQKEIVFKFPHYTGIPIWKNPFDLWIYQEILYEIAPDIIIEIGSRYGGSTKFFADLLLLNGEGFVISIDKYRKDYHLEHERVVTINGDSTSPEVLEEVSKLCRGKNALVIQDGDHSFNHVLKDLENYAKFVSVGSYFIVEDGIVDLFHEGDGLGFKDKGPLAATEKFLEMRHDFIVDESRERYILTYNPRGFLKRVR